MTGFIFSVFNLQDLLEWLYFFIFPIFQLYGCNFHIMRYLSVAVDGITCGDCCKKKCCDEMFLLFLICRFAALTTLLSDALKPNPVRFI